MATAATDTSDGRLRVLVVDDAPADRRLTLELLKESGLGPLDVLEAASVEDLWSVLEREHVDVILLDHGLGTVDGLAEAERVLDADPDAAVVLLSGTRDPAVDRAAAAAGLAGYLDKHALTPQSLSREVRFGLRRVGDRRALRADQQRYRDIMRCLPDAAVVCVDDQLVVQAIDGAVFHRAGLDPGTLTGMPIAEMLRQGGHDDLVAYFEAALDGRASEYLMRTSRDEDLLIRIGPRSDGDVITGAIAVAMDVTERRGAEARLARSEQRQRLMLANLPRTIVAVYDRDLRVVRTDGLQAEVDGHTDESVQGAHLSEFFDAPTYTAIEPLMRAGLAGEHRQIEHTGHDGRVYQLDVAPFRDDQGRIEGVLTMWRDISDAVEQHRRRVEAEERFRHTFERAPIGMAVTTPEGRFLQVNRALEHLTGYTAQALTEMAIRDLEAGSGEDRGHDDATESGPVHRHWRHADGRALWVALRRTVVHDAAGGPSHAIEQIVDVTESRRVEAELRHVADHDQLTGLLNRRGFTRELEAHTARAARYGPGGALLVLDLDHFKHVNDTHGHGAGDELIVQIAAVLRTRMRASDVLARLGGDEFAVLLPAGGAPVADEVAASLAAALRNAVLHVGGVPAAPVTASIGIALLGGAGPSAGQAFADADMAMYDAKAAGRARHAFAADADHAEPRSRSQRAVADRIERALETDGFVLFGQPVVDARTGSVYAHELLLRMKGPGDEVVLPGEFLPVAEACGLIERIDRWVLREAARMLCRRGELGVDGAISVNVSGRSVGVPGLLDGAAAELAGSPVDRRRLIIEITETAAVADLATAQGFARRVAQLGCRLALDDFGAGYGSFTYLKHLPFDIVKIDGEFVRDCARDATDAALIRALVDLARGLGKQTIAEFVEDETTRRHLATSGVDLLQGFHLGRPAPLPG